MLPHPQDFRGYNVRSYFHWAVLASFALIFSVAACQPGGQATDNQAVAGSRAPAIMDDPDSKPTVLRVAINSPDHTTLVAAVQAAELETVLSSPGPLTVFAPNNAAFEKLPAGTVEELLKPENKRRLANIVTSHASPGTFKGPLLKDGDKIYLATGQYVDVEERDGDTYVNGAKILGTVDAANGVVHVVDSVFLFF